MRTALWWLLDFFADRGVPGMLSALFLLVALVISPVGIVQEVHDAHFRGTAVHTTGTVVAQVDTGGRTGGTEVTVAYAVDARDYRFTEEAGDQRVDGRREDVVYDPVDPAHAELADNGLGDAVVVFDLTVGFALGGLALLLLGLADNGVRRLLHRPRRMGARGASPAPAHRSWLRRR